MTKRRQTVDCKEGNCFTAEAAEWVNKLQRAAPLISAPDSSGHAGKETTKQHLHKGRKQVAPESDVQLRLSARTRTMDLLCQRLRQYRVLERLHCILPRNSRRTVPRRGMLQDEARSRVARMPSGAGSPNLLASFAGKNRVLVISAPHDSDGYYRLMMSLLKPDVYCELAERHVHQVVMFHQEGEMGGKVRRITRRARS
ncbi:hypothetical protein WMY93_028500 [Mugilogobius chulae]|uniref:Coiled-coil domain-containing protein 80 n=1 Tax=Mugilogobius chulae TaxID=88201 RepID=A0AAW0N083_9GOBI